MPRLARDIETSLVFVEPPRAIRQPDPCPEPWAWYTPETLVESDGQVSAWIDATGNGRTLLPSSAEGRAVYDGNVIDGKAGWVTVDPRVDYFAETVDAPQPFDGHTMFVVANPVSTPPNDDSYLQLFTDLVHNMQLRGALVTDAQQWVGYGHLSGTDPRGIGPFAIGAWAATDGFDIGIEINGTNWNPSFSLDRFDPNGEPWEHNTSSFADDVIVDSSSHEGMWVAEVIIFNSSLTPECRSQWWSYLADRYPSLGIA